MRCLSSYDDDFPTCTETFSTLRLFSDVIQPSAITELLNIEPTCTFTKGEPNDRGFVRTNNGWLLSSEHVVSSKDTRRHIDWILSQIEPKANQLQDLRSKMVEMDISSLWVSTGQGGPVLSPTQMMVLARLELDVWWDVYLSRPPND